MLFRIKTVPRLRIIGDRYKTVTKSEEQPPVEVREITYDPDKVGDIHRPKGLTVEDCLELERIFQRIAETMDHSIADLEAAGISLDGRGRHEAKRQVHALTIALSALRNSSVFRSFRGFDRPKT